MDVEEDNFATDATTAKAQEPQLLLSMPLRMRGSVADDAARGPWTDSSQFVVPVIESDSNNPTERENRYAAYFATAFVLTEKRVPSWLPPEAARDFARVLDMYQLQPWAELMEAAMEPTPIRPGVVCEPPDLCVLLPMNVRGKESDAVDDSLIKYIDAARQPYLWEYSPLDLQFDWGKGLEVRLAKNKVLVVPFESPCKAVRPPLIGGKYELGTPEFGDALKLMLAWLEEIRGDTLPPPRDADDVPFSREEKGWMWRSVVEQAGGDPGDFMSLVLVRYLCRRQRMLNLQCGYFVEHNCMDLDAAASFRTEVLPCVLLLRTCDAQEAIYMMKYFITSLVRVYNLNWRGCSWEAERKLEDAAREVVKTIWDSLQPAA